MCHAGMPCDRAAFQCRPDAMQRILSIVNIRQVSVCATEVSARCGAVEQFTQLLPEKHIYMLQCGAVCLLQEVTCAGSM